MKRCHFIPCSVIALAAFSASPSSKDAKSQGVERKSDALQNAQPASPPPGRSTGPVPPFTMDVKGHLALRENKTATEIVTKRIKILSPGAVQMLSQQQVPFVEGMQKLETVQAFTEKADGRTISIDPSNIITRDAASGLQATYASDSKTRTFIFPDVAVGDTLVMTLKTEILRDFFNGEFMDFDLFPRSGGVSSVHYTIEAPARLDLAVGVTGDGVVKTMEIAGGVRRHTVDFVGAAYRPEEPGAVSPFDRDPVMSVSTFRSYADLGRAYGKAAAAQAKSTPQIAALAEDVTRGLKDRKAQAAAIDAWVKKNIRYVAVYFSVGRVVPHDAATILRNKFGDCKDKVTLMAAMLAAKGIESEAVLINLGSAYALPEPPTLAVLNHLIVYLPEFDLYDDPTANTMAFGTLAPAEYDKPVVRVSGSGASVARTPPARPQDHSTYVRTSIQFAADGTRSGQTEETSTGTPAGGLRSLGPVVQQVGQDVAAQRQLQSANSPGTGHIDLSKSEDLSDPIVIKSDFVLNDKFRAPAPSGIAAIPLGLRFSVRPGSSLLGARLSGRQSAFACLAGIQSEDIEATFDPTLPMPSPLPATSIDNPFFTYRSTYSIENRTLKIHREFVSRVTRQVCPVAAEAQITSDMNRVLADVTTGYKFNMVAPSAAFVDANADVVTGERKRIAFLYDANRDCSPVALPKVTTSDPPKQGKISIDRAMGNPRYPQTSPRFACNNGQIEGLGITYESARGFVGKDTFVVDVVFADGFVSKRRYAVRIDPSRDVVAGPTGRAAESAASPANASDDKTSPQPGSVQAVEVKRVAVRDRKLRVAAFFEINPDCSLVGIPTVRILSSSKNGKVILEDGTGFTAFAASNPRSKCNATSTNGAVISYMPEPGYIGLDSITAEIIYLDGTADTRRYAIEVR